MNISDPQKGAAASDGRIQVGDQLLEVNGVPLLGRCHLNAGAILQQLPGLHLKLLILRRPDAIKHMAVRPLLLDRSLTSECAGN